MPKLLFCYLHQHRKDFYLTMNIIDIILGVLFSGLFAINHQIHLDVYYGSLIELLDLILFIIAIIAIFQYFSRRHYHTDVHKIYMIIRLFTTIFKFLIICMSFLNLLQTMSHHRDKTRYTNQLVFLISLTLFNFLSLYWSYEFMRMIN